MILRHELHVLGPILQVGFWILLTCAALITLANRSRVSVARHGPMCLPLVCVTWAISSTLLLGLVASASDTPIERFQSLISVALCWYLSIRIPEAAVSAKRQSDAINAE